METTRKMKISSGDDEVLLPVNPDQVEISEPHLNQKVTLLKLGEANLIGKRGLVNLSISSFLPSSKSPFYKYSNKEPAEIISKFRKWKNAGKAVRVIITGIDINIMMSIDKLGYIIREGDEDVKYTLELTEYRSLNVSNTKGDKKKRPKKKKKPKKYTVKQGDTLFKIAKKIYGKGEKWKELYEKNKALIDKANSKKKVKKYTLHKGQVLLVP